MSTIHDFNAREWDIMGTQHNQLDGKRRITLGIFPGRKQSKSLACAMYFILALIGNRSDLKKGVRWADRHHESNRQQGSMIGVGGEAV